ncbi:hypothetical protein [Streptomyces sp. NPDC056948]|uniref:hypothetical protein n=1 Tax=Streptomyces sp. NPDC056948 TaxID=3345975 RepID=UPI00362C8875
MMSALGGLSASGCCSPCASRTPSISTMMGTARRGDGRICLSVRSDNGNAAGIAQIVGMLGRVAGAGAVGSHRSDDSGTGL